MTLQDIPGHLKLKIANLRPILAQFKNKNFKLLHMNTSMSACFYDTHLWAFNHINIYYLFSCPMLHLIFDDI